MTSTQRIQITQLPSASRKGSHPNLIRLLNERILHRLNTSYSHKDQPGVRYEIYTLDYGVYVRYQGTSSMPQQQIFLYADDISSMQDDEKAQ